MVIGPQVSMKRIKGGSKDLMIFLGVGSNAKKIGAGRQLLFRMGFGQRFGITKKEMGHPISM